MVIDVIIALARTDRDPVARIRDVVRFGSALDKLTILFVFLNRRNSLSTLILFAFRKLQSPFFFNSSSQIFSSRIKKFLHKSATLLLHNSRRHEELMIERGFVHDVKERLRRPEF